MKAQIDGIDVEVIDSPVVETPGGVLYHVTLESGLIATSPASWAREGAERVIVTATGEVFES